VELNGKEIIQQLFKRQTDGQEQKVMYVIVDAKEGDKITVTAYCNIAGKKNQTLDVTIEEQ
jgi:desulfoferrodoxin (superoxide reductase-like protein)